MHGLMTWRSLSHLPFAVIVAFACAVIIAFLYRSQLRSAHWFWRWTIPAFRTIAVITLIASALRPTLLKPAAPQDLGSIVILLDDSPSMSITDSSWTPPELVRLADSLHILPPGISRWPGQDLQSQVAHLRPLLDDAARAATELEYARLAGRSVESADKRAVRTRAALLAACSAMAARAPSLPDNLKPAWQWTDAATLLTTKGRAAYTELRNRAVACEKAIAASQADADARLYVDHKPLQEICDALSHLSRLDLSRQVIERSLLPVIPPGVPVRIVAASNPAKILYSASGPVIHASLPIIDPHASASDVSAALTLISTQQQGSHNKVRSILLFSDGRFADTPASVSFPPIVICRCTPNTVRDLAVQQITLPPVVYLGDDVAIHVDLHAAGYSNAHLTASITHNDTFDHQDVAVDSEIPSVTLNTRFNQPGVTYLTIDFASLPGEATSLNNSISRYLRVLPKRINVLALAGGGTLITDALQSVLSQTPGVKAQVLPAESLLTSTITNDISSASVLILDDISSAEFSSDQLEALRKSVAGRGATLILLPGRSHWPLDADSEADLDEFLPYQLAGGPIWRTGSDRPASAADNIDWPADALPTVGRYLQLGDLRPSAHPILLDPDSQSPILTEMPLGTGKILTLALDSSTADQNSAEARALWSSLIRYATGIPYAVQADGYALDTDQVDIPPTGAVTVRVKTPLHTPASRPPAIMISTADHILRSQPLNSVRPGRYTALLANLPPGDFTLQLDTGINDETAPILQTPLHVRSTAAAELADVTANSNLLSRLAHSTDGQLLSLPDANRLPDDILFDHPTPPGIVEYALWDSPYLFLFVTACLTTEWALRKRLGLA